MKQLQILFTWIFLLINIFLYGQNKILETSSTSTGKNFTEEELNKLPFIKRNWMYIITMPYLGYSYQTINPETGPNGHQSNFGMNIGTDYFVANNIGIGLEFDANLANSESGGTKQTNNSWMVYGNAMYGHSFAGNINMYIKVGAGVGGVTNKYTYPSTPTSTDKSNLFAVKARVGFPILIDQVSPVYFTPELYFRYQTENFDDRKETDNRFAVNLKLITSLRCKQMFSCNGKPAHGYLYNMYNQGHSFLGVTTKGMLAFGSLKTKYDNINYDPNKENYSKEHFAIDYKYYIVNHLAFGLGVDLRNQVNKGTNYKYTTTSWGISPMLEYNMPGKNEALNNFFIEGGASFGGGKTESTFTGSTSTNKYTFSSYCIGFGYNISLYKHLSLTPKFEYEWLTEKDNVPNQPDIKDKYNGPEFSIGVRKFFGKL